MKIIIIILAILFATTSFAQWNPANVMYNFNTTNGVWAYNPVKNVWSFNPIKNQWTYNTIDARWIQNYNAIERVALQVSPHMVLSTAIKDTYPAMYSLKKLWTGQTDTAVMFQRTLNSDSSYFKFNGAGILDTASVRAWLDTSIVVNGYLEVYTGTQDDGITDNFTSWTNGNTEQGTIDATATIYSGSNAVKMVDTTAQTVNKIFIKTATISLKPNTFYKLILYTRGDGTYAGTYDFFDGGSASYLVASGTTGTTSTTYTLKTHIFQTPSNVGSCIIELFGNATNGATIYYDNIRLTEVTPTVRKMWDGSGNGKHWLQLTSANQWRYNDTLAIRNDGSNDSMTVKNLGTIKGISFWVYPLTTQGFFSFNGGISIEVATNTITATGWTSPKIYVNGTETATLTPATWQLITVTSATSVNATWFKNLVANWKLRDVIPFKYQPSATQITNIYNYLK